ncbi:MAG: hypothetical protein AB1449_09165 [Chloroflexota bacterium]
MNQGLVLLVAVVAGIVCLIALFAVLQAFFPRPVERARHAIEDQPVRAFLVGLVNLVFLLALGAGLGALRSNLGWRFLDLILLLLFALFLVGAAFGLAGLVQVLGARLMPQRAPAARTAWGTAALTLACLTPYVGWFGLLTYSVMLGLGAFLIGLFSGRANGGVEQASPAL